MYLRLLITPDFRWIRDCRGLVRARGGTSDFPTLTRQTHSRREGEIELVSRGAVATCAAKRTTQAGIEHRFP
jgi:hypothetical protein